VPESDQRVATATYAPEPAAAAQARRFVRETLRSWGVPGSADKAPGLIDDAVLLTSELVTNAVVHAGTQVQVTCRINGKAVEVAVGDRHPARALSTEPKPVVDAAERTSGRGLMLPSALATAWGVTYARTAKAVWFRIGFADYPGDTVQVGDPPSTDALSFSSGSDAVEELLSGETLDGSWTDDADEFDDEPAVRRTDIGKLGYDELLRHTVELARDAVDADAAYALVADEDGELRMRAAAGLGPPAVLDALAGPAVRAQNLASRSVMTVPFLVEGRVTGILAAASAEADQFAEADSARLQRVADRMALSIERARLGELERARRGRVSFLAEASDLLAGTLDQEKIIALAAQLVVPRLATWCAVLLDDGAGAVEPAYVWHADESRLDALARLLDLVPVPDVPARGGGRSWSLALDDPTGLSPEVLDLAAGSAWCFPLAARGRSLGLLTIGRPRGGSLPREVTELAEDLARRTALALDNAQLYERQQETTRALQRSLLPPEVPQIPGLDLAVVHEVAGEGNEVGGDFYDVFEVGEGRWRFTIGDVCGTGPEAAAVTGLARHSLRILAGEGYGVAAVLARLNRLLLEDGAGRFITLIHGEIATAGARGTAGVTAGVTAGAGATGTAGAMVRAGATGTAGAMVRAGATGTAGATAGALTHPDGDPAGIRLSLVCAGHPLPLLLRANPDPAAIPPASPVPRAKPVPPPSAPVPEGTPVPEGSPVPEGTPVPPGTAVPPGSPVPSPSTPVPPPSSVPPGSPVPPPATPIPPAKPVPAAVPTADPQPLLGVMEELKFEAQDVFLSPGDLILCVTDGVTERRDNGRLLDDEDGLAKILSDCAGLSAGAVAARIQRAVGEFGVGPATDDMALLVLRAM
jgi:GAF domain-containing protein/anti-sigma regulatory factor (Ser/Thr protein kinase)